MGDGECLVPVDGRVPSTRNGTELSRFCDRLMARFVELGASQAKVAVEMTGFGADALYKGLWNASNKREFMGRVTVRKSDGQIVLMRGKRK